MTTIELSDYTNDPVTLDIVTLTRLAATWEPDVREQVVISLDDLALVCANTGHDYHRAVAEFLALSRRLIRSVGLSADQALEAHRGNA